MKEFIENYSRLRLDPMNLDRRIFSSPFTFNEKVASNNAACNFPLPLLLHLVRLRPPSQTLSSEAARAIECGSRRLGHLQLVRNFISSDFSRCSPEKSISIRKTKFANFSGSLLY